MEFNVLEDTANNIDDLNDTIGNVITQIRQLGYQQIFRPNADELIKNKYLIPAVENSIYEYLTGGYEK